MAKKSKSNELEARVAQLQKKIAEYQETDQRFQMMAESIQQVFWMTASQSAQIIYVSPAYEKIWGRTSEELYANPYVWLESVFPEDVLTVKNNWDDQLKGNSTYEEFRIRRPDGTIRWIANRAYPVIDSRGQVSHITGVATDISSLKAAQEASEALADMWQTTFDAVQNSICILDTDWTIIQANQATAKIFNRPIEEIIGRKCYEIIHGTLEPVDNCPVRRLNLDSQRETE